MKEEDKVQEEMESLFCVCARVEQRPLAGGQGMMVIDHVTAAVGIEQPREIGKRGNRGGHHYALSITS